MGQCTASESSSSSSVTSNINAARAAIGRIGRRLSSLGDNMQLGGAGMVGVSALSAFFIPEAAPAEIVGAEEGAALIEAGAAVSTLGSTLQGYARGGILGAAFNGFTSVITDRLTRLFVEAHLGVSGSYGRAYSGLLSKLMGALRNTGQACTVQ